MDAAAPHRADVRSSAGALLERAATARAAGDVEGVRALLVAAFLAARDAGAVDLMATAALALPTGQRFGVHPGQVPALLHEAYDAAEGPVRARLAAALARAWVYGGDAARAREFAVEAQALAEAANEAPVLADALDAALLVRWGPDDFAARVRLAARLADAVAHVPDAQLRLSGHLWRLTTAWECLDVVAVQRQLRALDLLADESGSPRVAFFAVSRRAMHALATGALDAADDLIERSRRLGAALAEPDVDAVMHSLRADRARQSGDREALALEAAAFEQYGAAEGVPSVVAEAAALWLAAGEPERAAALTRRLTGGGLGAVARDVDYLLTVGLAVWVAATLGIDDVAAEGAAALEPFAGRAVLNAGAVAFHGVVDDYLFHAHRALGTGSAARWRQAAAASYRRIGAPWWERRIGEPDRRVPARATTVHLHPERGGGWSVGPDGATARISDLKGLHYLRHLVARPGVEIAAIALSDAVAGHPGAGLVESEAGELIDRTALLAYRGRLAELDREIAEARDVADATALARLDDERDALLEQVGAALGLGGRPRRQVGGARERARVAVRKAVVTALDHVERADHPTARLLRDTVHTGASCRYEPDPSRRVRWVLEPARPLSGS